MRIRSVLLGVVAWAVVIALSAGAPPSFAQADSIQSVKLYPKTADGATVDENPVTVSFNGHLFEGGLWLSQTDPKTLTEPEKFLAHAIEANRESTPDEVLELWNPPERDDLAKLVRDPKMFGANQRFYRSIEDSALIAKILYGPYILFYVEHVGGFKTFIKEYPVISTASGYYLTNALQSDPVYQYFSTAYAKQLALAKRPGQGDGATSQESP